MTNFNKERTNEVNIVALIWRAICSVIISFVAICTVKCLISNGPLRVYLQDNDRARVVLPAIIVMLATFMLIAIALQTTKRNEIERFAAWVTVLVCLAEMLIYLKPELSDLLNVICNELSPTDNILKVISE